MAEKKEYVKLWLSYASYFEAYGAAEVGRLVLAMIKYRASGVEPEFSGSERFIWPAIKRDIDESVAAQESAADTYRENGKKGGRPKKPNGNTENQKNQSGFSETKKTYGQRTKDKGQGQGQGQGQGDNSAPARADDHTPAAAAVVADYLNRVNPSASDISLEELRSFADTLGEAVCKRAFDIALDEKKATWSYIRAILRDKAARGVKCLADWDALEAVRPKGPPGPKNAPAPMPGQPGEADRRAREDMEQLRELMRRESSGDD